MQVRSCCRCRLSALCLSSVLSVQATDRQGNAILSLARRVGAHLWSQNVLAINRWQPRDGLASSCHRPSVCGPLHPSPHRPLRSCEDMLEHFEDAVDVHDRILEQVDNLLDAHSGGAAASLQGVTDGEVERRMKQRQMRSDAKMERETVKDKPQHK